MTSNAELVRHLYDRFNARDIDRVLAALAVDVDWTHQWAVIDPHVEPVHVGESTGGSTLVELHQVVKDLEGKVLLDETVAHRFRVEEEHVTRFDIEGSSELSTIGH